VTHVKCPSRFSDCAEPVRGFGGSRSAHVRLREGPRFDRRRTGGLCWLRADTSCSLTCSASIALLRVHAGQGYRRPRGMKQESWGFSPAMALHPLSWRQTLKLRIASTGALVNNQVHWWYTRVSIPSSMILSNILGAFAPHEASSSNTIDVSYHTMSS